MAEYFTKQISDCTVRKYRWSKHPYTFTFVIHIHIWRKLRGIEEIWIGILFFFVFFLSCTHILLYDAFALCSFCPFCMQMIKIMLTSIIIVPFPPYFRFLVISQIYFICLFVWYLHIYLQKKKISSIAHSLLRSVVFPIFFWMNWLMQSIQKKT